MNNLLSKFKIKGKICHRIKTVSPHENWIILLRVFSVIILALIIFSLYLLYEIRNDQIFKVKSASSNSASILDENLLNKETAVFDQREKTSESIKANNSLYKDPSVN